ncbi:hypothetical protein [Paenibacillus sp. DMB20]|uniref:hypothetical protein n=1 Tax=Paenibacillus sp. DMB20 TaxID=1642570 RepID=UPI0006275610|nr:hypothetical protein [Paenibacillus sp. DMB20]KKO51136.1 hypothetical protein XI25_29560 [Paenibacillus sp. DMB20]
MEIKQRVRHKGTGEKGHVSRMIDGWVFVLLDGYRTALPYREEWLETIEEGEVTGGQTEN